MVITRSQQQQHSQQKAALLGVLLSVLGAASYYHNHHLVTEKRHNSKLSGREWVSELLNGASSRIPENLGMHKHVFVQLCAVLVRHGGLTPTRYVGLTEQLAMFLYMAVTGASNRQVQERFQRSGDTVSKMFYRVLNALTTKAVYGRYVRLPPDDTPDEIKRSKKLSPFFDACRAAIDGSHIACFPPAEDRPWYHNRKGGLSIKVLAACTWDMQFCYLLSGWEGSAADSFVYQAARAEDLHIPQGQYYLADAGFAGCDSLLVPYPGVRYHLREWSASSSRPANAEELYNLPHAQTRNVIERIFGVFKKRFNVMKNGCEYPMSAQARLVLACAVIHNFICTHDPHDLPELDEEELELDMLELPEREEVRLHNRTRGAVRQEAQQALERRDAISRAMWNQYQETLLNRQGSFLLEYVSASSDNLEYGQGPSSSTIRLLRGRGNSSDDT